MITVLHTDMEMMNFVDQTVSTPILLTDVVREKYIKDDSGWFAALYCGVIARDHCKLSKCVGKKEHQENNYLCGMAKRENDLEIRKQQVVY